MDSQIIPDRLIPKGKEVVQVLITHLYVKTNPDRRIGNHLFYGGEAQPFQKLQTIQQGKPERVSRKS